MLWFLVGEFMLVGVCRCFHLLVGVCWWVLLVDVFGGCFLVGVFGGLSLQVLFVVCFNGWFAVVGCKFFLFYLWVLVCGLAWWVCFVGVFGGWFGLFVLWVWLVGLVWWVCLCVMLVGILVGYRRVCGRAQPSAFILL